VKVKDSVDDFKVVSSEDREVTVFVRAMEFGIYFSFRGWYVAEHNEIDKVSVPCKKLLS
jgi:hypothetical protein